MPRIYHLLDEAEVFSEGNGGAISRWAANMLRGGEEIVVCPSYDNSWGFPDDRLFVLAGYGATAPAHPLLYRLPWPLQRTAYLRIFRELLARLEPGDLVYVHNRPEAAGPLASVANARGFHVALHMHNSHLKVASRGLLQALRKTPIVFCSDFLRREIAASLPEHFLRTYLVYNGADDTKFYAADEPSRAVPQIIFTGRLVPYKGVHVLLEAMRLLEQHGVDAVCKVVGGSGFGNSRRTRYVKKLNHLCPGNTELLGYRRGKEIGDLLRDSAIYCCPSIWNDPFPLSVLEAMASGLALVASAVGGIPEALAYGGGLLVPPENPEALAEALTRVVNDPVLRQKLAADARQSFQEHFSWSDVRRQYEAILPELLA